MPRNPHLEKWLEEDLRNSPTLPYMTSPEGYPGSSSIDAGGGSSPSLVGDSSPVATSQPPASRPPNAALARIHALKEKLLRENAEIEDPDSPRARQLIEKGMLFGQGIPQESLIPAAKLGYAGAQQGLPAQGFDINRLSPQDKEFLAAWARAQNNEVFTTKTR
jgi:hypothetical protein